MLSSKAFDNPWNTALSGLVMFLWLIIFAAIAMFLTACAPAKIVPNDTIAVIARSMPIPAEAQFALLADLPDCGAKFEKLFIILPGATHKVGEWHICDDAVVNGLPEMDCARIPAFDRTIGGSCKLQVTECLAQWAALPECNAEEAKLAMSYTLPDYRGRLLLQYDGTAGKEYGLRAVPVDAGESLPSIHDGFDRSCLMWVRDGRAVPRHTI